MGVAGGISVVLAVVVIVAYRNYKYEQELDSLLWKVDPKDLKVGRKGVSMYDKTLQGARNTPCMTSTLRVVRARNTPNSRTNRFCGQIVGGDKKLLRLDVIKRSPRSKDN